VESDWGRFSSDARPIFDKNDGVREILVHHLSCHPSGRKLRASSHRGHGPSAAAC
jgi:hypothetical protein